jgi:hypothetical protein
MTSRVGGTYALPVQVDALAKRLRKLRVAVDDDEPGAQESLQSFISIYSARSQELLQVLISARYSKLKVDDSLAGGFQISTVGLGAA